MMKLDPLSTADFQSPQQWGADDIRQMMAKRMRTKDPVQRKEMMKQEQAYFESLYGTDAARYDETGKMIMPEPKRSVAVEQPLTMKDGKDLSQLWDYIRQEGMTPQGRFYSINPIMVQKGLNLSKQANLKEDDVMGPKTQRALQQALLSQGSAPVEEAVGLGQFQNLAETVQQRGGQPEATAEEMRRIFSPLLGGEQGQAVATQVLQDTLNDQGAGLKDDGVLGSKTASAFAQALKKQTPRDLTASFGQALGFLQN